MHKRQALKAYKDGSRSMVNKQTNTPNNFVLCSLCEEKFSPKNSPSGCLGDQERSIREYSNALDYINSCHSIINHMMGQNKEFKDIFVSMPNVPNFLELFSMLLTQDFETKKQQKAACEPHITRSEMLKRNAEEDFQRQTSDSETSDFEMDVLQNGGKIPLQKFRSRLPRTEETIYEEDIPEIPVQQTKRVEGRISKSPKTSQRKISPPSPTRVKRYSDIVTPPSQGINQDINRKTKPRSYSANASRTKNVIEKKSGHDLSANYSDTVISTGGNARQSDLTQQDLDKYAKELLGTPNHSPRSTSPHNRSPNMEKSPSRGGRKSPKSPTPSSQGGRRYSELLKRGYSDNQHRQSVSADSCNKQSTLQKVTHMEQSQSVTLGQNSNQQQNQVKRQKPSVQSMPEQSQNRPNTPTVKNVNNYSVFGGLQGKEPNLNEDNPYTMQEYIQMKKNRGKVPDSNKDQDGYDRKLNLRTTASKCGVDKGKLKEGFNSRKLSPSEMKIIESQVQLFVEQHIEADDIKTDSDIEEDQAVKKQIVDDRSARIKEEEAKNFRGKFSESEDEDQIGKFPEEHAYSTTTDGYQRIHQIGSNGPKRSHISDESSDIKSDEDAYDHRRQIHVHRRGASYTYTHGTVRH